MKRFIKIYRICPKCKGTGRRPNKEKTHTGEEIVVGRVGCDCEEGYEWIEYQPLNSTNTGTPLGQRK